MFRAGTLLDWGVRFSNSSALTGPQCDAASLLRVFPFSAAAGQQSQRGGRPAGWGGELHGDAAAARRRRR